MPLGDSKKDLIWGPPETLRCSLPSGDRSTPGACELTIPDNKLTPGAVKVDEKLLSYDLNFKPPSMTFLGAECDKLVRL